MNQHVKSQFNFQNSKFEYVTLIKIFSNQIISTLHKEVQEVNFPLFERKQDHFLNEIVSISARNFECDFF